MPRDFIDFRAGGPADKRVFFLPNDEAFLKISPHFFRVPPEGAFGVSAAKIEEMVRERAASWAEAWDSRMAVAGRDLWQIIQDVRAQSAPAVAEPSEPDPPKPTARPRRPQGAAFAAASTIIASTERTAISMGTATEQWNAMLEQYKARGLPNDKAVRMIAVKHPRVHKAYIAEYNAEAQNRRAQLAALEERRQAQLG